MKATRRSLTYVIMWLLVGAVIASLVVGTYQVNVSRAAALEQQAQNFLVYASEPASTGIAVLSPSSSQPRSTLAVGVSYAHFVVLANQGLVYATAFGNDSSTLFVLALPNLNEVATVPVGLGAHHLTMTPDGALVFVSAADGTLSEVNTTNSALVRKINLGGAPQDVAVSSKYGIALVANSGSDAVQAVDIASWKVVDSVTGLGKPVKLSIADDQSFAVVTNEGSQTLVLLKLPNLTVEGKIAFSTVPHQLYLDSARGYARCSRGRTRQKPRALYRCHTKWYSTLFEGTTPLSDAGDCSRR